MENNGGPGPVRGGYRGRGGPHRGGFDPRGRGRGMGRGGLMGGRGGMPPMMRGRGGLMRGPPRGMGHPPRGMGPPRGGPPSRGAGRPPGPPGTGPGPAPTQSQPPVSAEGGSPIMTTTSASSGRGLSRGRGLPRGRGAHGGPGAPNNTTIPGTGPDPKPIPRSDSKPRGFLGRGGRGFNSNGPSRILTGPRHLLTPGGQGNAPVPSLKRNGPGGLPGPKRGRYESGPPARTFPPKPIYAQSASQHQPPHISQYNSTQQAPSYSYSHHSGYQGHDPNQGMDTYSQSYNQQTQSNYSNNGYGQSSYGDTSIQNSGYSQPVNSYDQHHYQDYCSANAYTSQDTRYQYSTPDYNHQTSYGASTDYSAAPQDPYQQPQYDDRTYGGYDANAYSQNYVKTDTYQSHGGYY